MRLLDARQALIDQLPDLQLAFVSLPGGGASSVRVALGSEIVAGHGPPESESQRKDFFLTIKGIRRCLGPTINIPEEK
jgi:hypothetical protein